MQSTTAPTSRSAPPTPSRPSVRRRGIGLAPPAAALLFLALLVAGCGGSSPSSGVAHIGTPTNASASSGSGAGGTPQPPESSAAAQRDMVKFSQCMRTHGEPEFPEPNSEGAIAIHNQNGKGINPESPQFQAAEKACGKYAPKRQAPSPQQQAKLQEQALKMAQCMRSHGVPNFPDPSFSANGGRVRLKAGKGTGLEPNSPQFQAAAKACQGNSPLGKGLVRAAPAPGGGAGPKGGGAQSSQSVGIAP